MSAVLQTIGLAKSFGAVRATQALDLEVEAGTIHAVIGPNGAGKTTLVAQIAGELRPDAGRIYLQGQDVTRWPVHVRARAGLARSFQVTNLLGGFSLEENVAIAVQARRGSSFRFWGRAAAEPALRAEALLHLERVGLAGLAERDAAQVGHGERRLLELAMALAQDPVLLLLDEPLAGLGTEESRRIVDLLRALREETTLLLIEHDMDAVFALADRVTVLVQGTAIASGPPAAIRADPEVRRAYLGEDEIW